VSFASILSLFLMAALPAVDSPSAAPAEPVFPAEDWSYHASPEEAGYDSEALGRMLRFVRDEAHTTGLMVVVGGEVLVAGGDVEELSYIASCRKSVLAMLYGNYVADGTIDLDRSLEDLGMDDLGGLLPLEKTATVRHLITARSGVYHPASNGGDSSADAPPRGSQDPGTYFLYNNWDFNAAGAAFERMTGTDIFDALRDDLAIPLGMQDFDRSRQRKTGDLTKSRNPAYHMWLSTRDMARLGYVMLRGGRWHDRQVIPAGWVKEMIRVTTPVEQMQPERNRSRGFGYGVMWWIWDGDRATGAFEGAYTAKGYMGQFITVLPALDMVVAHKTKADYGRTTSWTAYREILDGVIAAKN